MNQANQERQQLRSLLIDELSAIILGPKKPNERLSAKPSETYLTGILWPRQTKFEAAEDERIEKIGVSRDEDASDAEVPGYRAIKPCSLGLTFSVPLGAVVKISTGKTARYRMVEALDDENVQAVGELQDFENEEENSSGEVSSSTEGESEWVRSELQYSLVLASVTEGFHRRFNQFEKPDGTEITDPDLEIDVLYRVDHDQGLAIITTTLINNAPAPNENDESTPLDERCLFQSGLSVFVSEDAEVGILPRPTVESAGDPDSKSNSLIYRDAKEFAVGHGVSAIWPHFDDQVREVHTAWIPIAFVKSMSHAGHPSLAKIISGEINLFSAAWLSEKEKREEIIKALYTFCEIYGNWIKQSVAGRIDEFEGQLKEAAITNAARCQSSMERMLDGVNALEVDDTLWEAFCLANQALNMQSNFPSKGERAGDLIWRPFQLAFMLLVIPGIANPENFSRSVMDLLWFPTGGGKTEAYLGLTALTIFLARLRTPFRRESGGTDVLMRYTLRLLTVQQFQRAAAMIVACELIRADNAERLGSARIELGLYVGQDSTPNWLSVAEEKLSEERRGNRPRSTPRQMLECPVCGNFIGPNDYKVDADKVHMSICCATDDCRIHGQDLPVHTVDETIFAKTPSLLIGTVDKFAQLPRNEQLARVFGLDTPAKPELIIQDELHLISGPLGTVTGLYESAIDLLCSHNGVRPKIIGSTATIGQAEAQVRALFDRTVMQFPPPAIDSSDSFFAVRDDEAPDRIYLGIASAGRSPKFALQSALGSAMQTVYSEFLSNNWPNEVIDPYWTAVAYFNSLRELGGAIVMMLDDVPRTMTFVAGRQGYDDRVLESPPVELSSRIASSEIPSHLADLNQSLGGGPFDPNPVDAVLASNMISVGVDIPRLGLMIVNGQPKSTAEYIQATSRVGRGLPGLICTVLNFGRPRDVAHFEHFQAYHAAMYRNVEATSVTPWASRARDKALHAVFISAVRQLSSNLRGDFQAKDFENSILSGQVLDFIVARSGSATSGEEQAATRADLERIVATWNTRAAGQRASGGKLRYWEKKAPFGRTAPHLMRDAERMRSTDTPAWATPNSMREIEPSTVFVLKEFLTSNQQQEENDA